MKGRIFEIVILKKDCKVNIAKVLDCYSFLFKEYMYIDHSNDDCLDHYHVVVRCSSYIDSAVLASLFLVPKNYVARQHCEFVDLILYSLHYYPYSNMHKYLPADIKANFDVQQFLESHFKK